MERPSARVRGNWFIILGAWTLVLMIGIGQEPTSDLTGTVVPNLEVSY